ncbi:MAG TPA: P-loop NTPase [Thermoplasmata archaeon]|nr:P-loop NTPase [Thermoplasmata archaeon]HIH97791.1 P-loop NTPase [Thermoplasmata archaeon]
MIISIASGKGGTGKTTVAVNLALTLSESEDIQLLDCDVEEPNAHLFLRPEIKESYPVTIPVPVIDEEKCDHCGKCSQFCEFNALAVLESGVMVFEELCHGCGGCGIVCPKNAITERNREIGQIEKGFAKNYADKNLAFALGRLNIGEAMASPLIRKVKEEIDRGKTAILDVPPGTSCPVIESIYGSDCCLLVTEPTPFGLYDLKLAVGLLKKLGIPFGIVINRSTGEKDGDRDVEEYCRKEKAPVLMKIPYDRQIAELYSKGVPFIEEMLGWKKEFLNLLARVREIVE